jgi:ornithine carbamoyltransferase
MADLFTLQERFGSVQGLRLAFVGDGNNVCHSLMIAAMKLGVHMTAITPPQYAPKADVVARCLAYAQESGATLTMTSDPAAVAGHDAIYTDVWTSMGAEAEAAVRDQVFKPFQVNRRLMDMANMGALFMHCLPAHRGQEVTDEVIDGPYSVVMDQAENRMHVQNAILLHLLAPGFRPSATDRAAGQTLVPAAHPGVPAGLED